MALPHEPQTDERPRLIEIALEQRGVSCIAALAAEEAPVTCAFVWDQLPVSAPAFHAKTVGSEVYCYLPIPPPENHPGLENSTLAPVAGDIAYWNVPSSDVPVARRRELGVAELPSFTDLAIFYANDNFLFSMKTGPAPATVFARVVSGLEAMAEACADVLYRGAYGERLRFARVESDRPDAPAVARGDA